MSAKYKSSVRSMLEDHKARVESNLLMKFFLDNNFNKSNIGLFRACVFRVIDQLPSRLIEYVSFKQISALTLFCHEFNNLYLTYRDAMAMLPDRNKEEDIVEFEKYTEALCGIHKGIFDIIFKFYDDRISEYKKQEVVLKTHNNSAQFLYNFTERDPVMQIGDAEKPFSWAHLSGCNVIANSANG